MGKKVNMMTDEEKIVKLYKEMYAAMINKDRAKLERIHDETFALIHMTGMKQSKDEYIAAIMNGTLNYYSAVHEETKVAIDGNSASLTGKSKVAAAVFGGGKSTWRLRLDFELIRENGEWYFTLARASTY
ncbi:MAG: nuclear transport factor 2 family protein [Oscillospiraceae bacterium]|nr:nuclear transport factor 2 family protein [Oscillospiraceae bacterium]